MKQRIILFLGLVSLPAMLFAQESRIERSVITIPNTTRAVMNLKVTDRAYLPMKSFGNSLVNVPDIKLRESNWPLDSLPKIQPPAAQDMRANETNKTAYGDKYSNAVEFGLGNYGHTLFNFDVGQSKKENKFFGMHVHHDANQFGPVKSEYSARSENQIRFENRSLGKVNYWESTLGYQQQTNNFYGLSEIPTFLKQSDIEVTYRRFNAEGKVSSAKQGGNTEYLFLVSGDQLRNSSDLSETVIRAKAIYGYKLSEHLRFKLVGDYIFSEYKPNSTLQKWNRNLQRINPHLAYKSSRVSLNAGFLYATEFDNPLVEKTSVFPMLQMDFGASDYIHLFGGIGGDVQFNSLQSFLNQNPWMRIPSQLKNTNQVGHVYGGIKGIGENKKIDFEVKYDYAEYSDLPFLINAVGANNKFDVQYRGGLEKIQVSNFTGNLNLNFSSQFTSSFKFNHVIHQQLGVQFHAPHVPSTTLSWTNSWRLSPKIVISPDVYWMKSLFALEPVKNQLIQLDDILDVNFKINYFIKRNMNLGLSGNNLLGKNYQRYYQYQVQGLNATLSFAYSF
ncbi:TonB-dependent receptor [Aquirufa sp. 5-AUSEE-100C1]